jgi:hypothetical protein
MDTKRKRQIQNHRNRDEIKKNRKRNHYILEELKSEPALWKKQ